MSTAHRTICTVTCDHPGCKTQERTEGPSSNLRRTLAVRGWAVDLPGDGRGDPHKDFCPEHKTEGQR